MQYRAIAKVSCPNCRSAWVIDTDQGVPPFIEAKSEAEAAERFRLMHRICPTCLAAGTPAAVEFDGFIQVATLPHIIH
jgi:hypothetical protein